MAEASEINDELLHELEKRDQTINEAIAMICDLEQKLEMARTPPSPSTTAIDLAVSSDSASDPPHSPPSPPTVPPPRVNTPLYWRLDDRIRHLNGGDWLATPKS